MWLWYNGVLVNSVYQPITALQEWYNVDCVLAQLPFVNNPLPSYGRDSL